MELENAALRLHVQKLEDRLKQSSQSGPVASAMSQKSISIGLTQWSQTWADTAVVPKVGSCLQPECDSITQDYANPDVLEIIQMADFTSDEPLGAAELVSHLDYSTADGTSLELFEPDLNQSPLITGICGIDMISEPLAPQAVEIRQSTFSLTEASTSTASGDANLGLEGSGSTLNEAQMVLSAAESDAYSLVF